MAVALMMGEADIKADERAAIEREVQAFLAKGGIIEKIAPGLTTGKAPISKAGVIDGWVDWNRWTERL